LQDIPVAPKHVRSAWFDESSKLPIIDEQAQRLESFMKAMADGRIDTAELETQQARLVKLMKEIEPELSDEVHAKVTQLLVELTAYDLMKALHSMHAARPKTVFRG
jgi:hypothetical protein